MKKPLQLITIFSSLSLAACFTADDDPKKEFGYAVSETSYFGEVEFETSKCSSCTKKLAKIYKKRAQKYSNLMSDLGLDMEFEVKVTESPYAVAHTDTEKRPRTVVMNVERIFDQKGNPTAYMLHEMGHHYLGHSTGKCLLENELEADKFVGFMMKSEWSKYEEEYRPFNNISKFKNGCYPSRSARIAAYKSGTSIWVKQDGKYKLNKDWQKDPMILSLRRMKTKLSKKGKSK